MEWVDTQKVQLDIYQCCGSGAFLTPGSGIRSRFFLDPGSWIWDPADPKPIFLRPYWQFGIGKNQDPGSGINIPDPEHWYVRVLVIQGFFDILTGSGVKKNNESCTPDPRSTSVTHLKCIVLLFGRLIESGSFWSILINWSVSHFIKGTEVWDGFLS